MTTGYKIARCFTKRSITGIAGFTGSFLVGRVAKDIAQKHRCIFSDKTQNRVQVAISLQSFIESFFTVLLNKTKQNIKNISCSIVMRNFVQKLFVSVSS